MNKVIKLHEHVVEIDGKQYVPIEIAQQAIIEVTESVSTLGSVFNTVAKEINDIDND